MRRLDGLEVVHEDVPLGVLGQAPGAGVDAQLDGAHQLVGRDLLVGHLLLLLLLLLLVGRDLLVGHLACLLIDTPMANLSVSFTVGTGFGVAPSSIPVFVIQFFTLVF